MSAPSASLLPYELSVCGLAEIGDFAESGVTHALSILDPEWPDPEVFGDFADGLLGRRGRLIGAMRSHHRRMIERWPKLAASLREGERARDYWQAG